MTHRILLADDSVTIRKVVELTFSDEDFTIDSVGDGAQALEHARAQRPDIIISDVVMPGLNGYELCQQVKGDPGLRSVPFLFLKGTFESFDEEKAHSCGADGFIVKPFESQEMVDKVRTLIERAIRPPEGSPVAMPVPPPRTASPAGPAVVDWPELNAPLPVASRPTPVAAEVRPPVYQEVPVLPSFPGAPEHPSAPQPAPHVPHAPVAPRPIPPAPPLAGTPPAVQRPAVPVPSPLAPPLEPVATHGAQQRPAMAPPPFPTMPSRPSPAPPPIPATVARPAPPIPPRPIRPLVVSPVAAPSQAQPTPPRFVPPQAPAPAPPPAAAALPRQAPAPAPVAAVAPPPPPPPPPPASAKAPAEDFGFDFGDTESDRFGAIPAQHTVSKDAGSSLDSSGESDEDLWSEVSLRGNTDDLLEMRSSAGSGAPSGEDILELAEEAAIAEPEVSFEDETVFEEVSTALINPVLALEPPPGPSESAAPVNPAVEFDETPVVTAPPAAPSPAEPATVVVDQAEIERIVAARVEAAVRKVLEPIVSELAKTMIEAVAWEVIPDLAEAMIRAEIERVRQSPRTD